MHDGINYGSIPVTNSESSATSSTATIAGIKGKQIQVVGFSGSSSDQAVQVQLQFGGVAKFTLHSGAASVAGLYLTEAGGPVAASGEAVSVVTTPAALGQCDANLLYRIIN